MFRTGAIEAERLIPLGFAVSIAERSIAERSVAERSVAERSVAERSLPESAKNPTVTLILELATARWRD